MKKSNKILIAMTLLIAITASLSANAQGLGPIGFDDGTSIDEAVPINGLVYLAMLVGGCIGFKKLNNEK